MKYSASFKSKEQIYRNYKTDILAIKGFKLYAIQTYNTLTDISKKDNNKWIRIRWT